MVAAIYDTSGSYNTAWILLLILTLGAFAGWIWRIYRIQKVLPKACGGQYAEYAGRAIKPEAKRPQTIQVCLNGLRALFFICASFSFVFNSVFRYIKMPVCRM